MLALGFGHAVLLREDGTVFAAGDNSFGQTEVSQWRDVVAVAAGAVHTLGLTRDGRVLSAGDNSFGQCDTNLFSGVTAIAAGYYDSYCLMSDGRVMHVGFQPPEKSRTPEGTERLWAGAYGWIAVGAGGTAASHPSLATAGDWRAASVSRGYAVGIDGEGRLASSLPDAPEWTGLCRVSAGEEGFVALTEAGEVLACPFGRHGRCSFRFDQPVTDIAAGPERWAFLLTDGTLVIRDTRGNEMKYRP